jgi:hypothetical protein
MTFPFSLPQNCKIVTAIAPSAGAAVTGDYISLKNAHKCWVVILSSGGNATAATFGINEATAVAPTAAGASAALFPNWINNSTAVADALTKNADAATVTTDGLATPKLIVIEVDPALLTAGYDCIAVTEGASNAANITSAIYVIAERYQQATPPAAITD